MVVVISKLTDMNLVIYVEALTHQEVSVILMLVIMMIVKYLQGIALTHQEVSCRVFLITSCLMRSQSIEHPVVTVNSLILLEVTFGAVK